MIKLADWDPSDISVESQFLLEVEVDSPDVYLVQKEYWVAAVKAALIAGRQTVQPRQTNLHWQGSRGKSRARSPALPCSLVFYRSPL